MSDLAALVIALVILSLIVLPAFLVVGEKLLVLLTLERIEDLVDLAIAGVVLELDREALSIGELQAVRQACEKRVQRYLSDHLIEFKNADVSIKLVDSRADITALIEARLTPHVFKRFLPKEVPYEIARQYQLYLDR